MTGGKFAFGLAAFLLGASSAFIASAAAPDFPGIPGRAGPPAIPGVPGRDAGPPPVTFPQVAPQRNDTRDYRDGTDPFAIEGITAIDSADSCKLNQGSVYVSATGQCPDGKTCTLQERRKNSVQDWKNSAANPNPVESQMEYRPDCVY